MGLTKVLTGIKPTHLPHLGNYIGAIRPAVAWSKQSDIQACLFIADYHALTSVNDAHHLREMIDAVSASWLACGLDPQKNILYKQSDVPETFELQWILSCLTPKGLMNRAHAYKAKVQENEENGKKDFDDGVNMGLYSYPVLMAADILLLSADKVPVGEDQTQHLEITRDIAQKFNNTYKPLLKVPELVTQKSKLVVGLDGRKMSKSYNNHIPLFEDEKSLRKKIMKIKTDSSDPSEPKDPDNSLIMDLYKEFASEEQIQDLRQRYLGGIAWGHAKEALFEAINIELKEKREIYLSLMENRKELHQTLEEGAEKARVTARTLIQQLREAVGVGSSFL